MAVAHDVITVGTSPVRVSIEEVVRSFDARAQSVLITAGDADVFVGGPGVTTTDYGYKIASGASLPADLGPSDVLYAVAAGTTTVAVLYLGV